MRLSEFSWQNRKAILFLAGVFCILGLYFSTHLPVSIFPNLTVPRIIITASSGDTPIPVMLADVTRPLENAAASVPNVTRIRSMTIRGNCELDVNFAWGTDMLTTLQRLQARISQIQSTLPPGTQVFSERLNPSVFPIMGYALYSSTISPAKLRTLALYTIRPRLLRVPGVREISVLGGDTPDFQVVLDPKALLQYDISVNDVEDALAKNNNITSVGYYDQAFLHYQILVSGRLHNTSDIANLTVAVKHQIPITIGDLGKVFPSVEKRMVETSGNGHDAVLINVVKQQDANTVEVAHGITKTLDAMKPQLPSGITYSVFYDQSQIVEESKQSVVEAIVVGGILALLVIFSFLKNLRTAFVVLFILPLSILFSFVLMKLFHQTLNIMTLGAMAIALGLVTDDGIVVAENIFRELEQGKTLEMAVADGVHAITPAMVGSSLATMAAFFPLMFLSGITGQFIAPLSIVMNSTLGVSLLLSLLLLPILARFFWKKKNLAIEHAKSNSHPSSGVFAQISRAHSVLFQKGFLYRKFIFAFILGVGLFSAFLLKHLKTGFFPEFDEGGFVLDYRMPAGTSLAETSRVCQEIERILAKTPEVAAWSRRTGAQLGFDITTQNTGDFSVRLKQHRSKNIFQIMEELRQEINTQIPAVKVDFGQILQDNIGDIAGTPRPVEIKIFGEDEATLERLARKTAGILSSLPGIVDINNGIVGSGPEVEVKVNSREAKRYGLTAEEIQQSAQAGILGSEPTFIQEGEQAVGVRVVVGHVEEGFHPQELGDLPIFSPTTKIMVPLRAVASIDIRQGTPQITRENQQTMIPVTANIEGIDLGSAIQKVKSALNKKLVLPQGYHIVYGGLYESQQESFRELTLVLGTSALFVFTLLLIQFQSFFEAFALFCAALLSLSGVFLGLFLAGIPLNISSFTGAIMIVGIITENGIVLFDFFNQLKKEKGDVPLDMLLLEAGKKRLRPILMTTFAAILGLFPLSLGIGAGAAMQKPLAAAVIGGLFVSTFFTLILAPVLYIALEEGWERRRKKMERETRLELATSSLEG
jgi:CzcA family heavy metal efflux pump